MDSTIIIVLAMILLALIILNNIKIVKTDNTTANCSQTTFGCCSNGVDSKINYYGTNCPGYKPRPGYLPTPNIPPPNPVLPPNPLPGPVPGPSPPPKKPIGGCAGTRYGCCPDNNTPKFDQSGSNCLIH
jgi:hypothetical protein